MELSILLEKTESLPIFSSVKLSYKKAGNTETEKFQNLYYEQNIYFKQNPTISKIN